LKSQQTHGGFAGVPEAVWDFQIGDYPVCEKWLKDRRGRRLSKDVLRGRPVDRGGVSMTGEGPTIVTPRLVLRPWRESDLALFAALNADPKVMEHMFAMLGREESDRLAERINQRIAERGFGLWAVEAPGVAGFVGFVGLSVPAFEAHFTPCVEVGWRLAAEYWGRGYATEAARAAVDFGFRGLGLEEIVSFTTPVNVRSWRVMERLGMKRSPADDFDHPAVARGHPLSRHVLYRLRRDAWRATHRQEVGTTDKHR
jgi:RimJ/RimL family protein N-acetyltransferase